MESDVAVIMPTYQRPISLPHAIESVVRQTYQKWKLYVIGDGDDKVSEDIVKGYIKKFRSRIVWHNMPQNHGGIHTNKIVQRGDTGACARNTAFFMSKEPYIAYLDDDDSYRSNHLALLMGAIIPYKFDFVFSRGNVWRKPNIKANRPGIVGGPAPGLARIGTNSFIHTRRIAQKILIPVGDKVTVPLTGKTWPAGTKVLRFECCRNKPGILWLPAKICDGCHDWDLIKRMMSKGARWKHMPKVTYDIYWDISQEQFKEFVLKNPVHRRSTMR